MSTRTARKASKLTGKALSTFRTAIAGLQAANVLLDQEQAEARTDIEVAEQTIAWASERISDALVAQRENDEAITALESLIGGGAS